jgi:hypothetical protein
MKHSNSLQHLKKFVYVDSSEEEEEEQHRQEGPKGERVKRECGEGNQTWGDDEGYRQEMKQLIQSEIDKIEGGRLMLVAV